MSEICVASHHESIAQLLEDSEFRALANRDGFLIELRLDFYSDVSPENLDRALDVFAPNVVVTFRHADEGGKTPNLRDSIRISYLQQAANRGVKYVDIELRTTCTGFQKGTTKVIASYHDFRPDGKMNRFAAPNPLNGPLKYADVLKFATFDSDFVRQRLLSRGDRPEIVIGMGEAGLWSRVLGPLFGSPLTYARGEGAPGTAPGQLTWRELDELYRYREIKPGWPVFGVIGNPIGHSLSPLLHNTAFKSVNLPGVYLPFKVEGDPVEFVRQFEPLGLKGISITIPHKEARWEKLAEIDPLAKHVGAVNTLYILPNGRWCATNTDAAAAADSLEAAAGSLKDKNVVVIGAGGAARAVAFGVQERGARIFVLNRTRERAEALARDLGAQACSFEDFAALERVDAIVNTTPLGMHPNVETTPLEKDQIPLGSIVFDTVYNPLRTKLLKLAEERGCRTVEGVSMFVRQGVRQFELFTGVRAPESAVREVVLVALQKRQH